MKGSCSELVNACKDLFYEIKDVEKVLRVLVEKGIVSRHDIPQQSSHNEKVDNILELVKKKGSHGFTEFRDALKKIGEDKIVAELDKAMESTCSEGGTETDHASSNSDFEENRSKKKTKFSEKNKMMSDFNIVVETSEHLKKFKELKSLEKFKKKEHFLEDDQQILEYVNVISSTDLGPLSEDFNQIQNSGTLVLQKYEDPMELLLDFMLMIIEQQNVAFQKLSNRLTSSLKPTPSFTLDVVIYDPRYAQLRFLIDISFFRSGPSNQVKNINSKNS